jgi:F-type H+-transporting ATPase subunit gamma
MNTIKNSLILLFIIMATGKEMKQKIRSISNTKNITRAMEMISAIKMKKAQDKALLTRPYAQETFDILYKLQNGNQIQHPLTQATKGNRVLIFLITSNRGLCGGFHARLFRFLQDNYKDVAKENIDFITLGKKGNQFAKRNNYNTLTDFSSFPEQTTFYDSAPIQKLLVEKFSSGQYKHVAICSLLFRSALVQEPYIQPLLPFHIEDAQKSLQFMFPKSNFTPSSENISYTYEPDEEKVFSDILPHILNMQIYQAILESKAGEHSARMIAMQQAKENAESCIEDLKQSYNKARQASVTQEISEIVSGVESMQ